MDAAALIQERSEYLRGWSGSLLSSYVSIAIYGTSLLQIAYYFVHYDRDRPLWKALVAVVFSFDTISLALFLYCLYYYLIISWGPPDGSGNESRVYPAEFCISTIIVVIVQGFYINCIHTLNAHKLVVLSLALLSLTSFAIGVAMVPLYSPLTFDENAKRIGTVTFSVMLYVSRGIALACDFGIVAAMWAALGGRRAFSRPMSLASTGTSRKSEQNIYLRTWKSNGIISAILALAIERGVVLTAVQAGELIAYSIRPCTMFFVPFHIVAIRIYSASLLATLNARSFMNESQRSMRRHAISSTVLNIDPPSPPVLRIEPASTYIRGNDAPDCMEMSKVQEVGTSTVRESSKSFDDLVMNKYDTMGAMR